ncbi:kinase [Thraustotheca clavata]|uniref:Kinase n=1 Tax=Thraustotheca clavata TaxID=74557 RepID=A0A1W0A9B7_9STRA|nr:kinase [Thraustotheca clavata]
MTLVPTTEPLANTTAPMTTTSNPYTTSINASIAGSSSGRLYKTQTPTSQSSSSSMIAGVVCGSLAVALVFALYAWRRKKKSVASQMYQSHFSPREEDIICPINYSTGGNKASKAATATTSTDSTSPREPPPTSFVNLDCLRMFRLEPRDLRVIADKPISSGAFGEVWLGVFVHERVAIKRVKDKSVNNIRRFRNEINLMSNWLRPTDLECVVEYMNRGDLRTILESMSRVEFSWEEKLAIIISIVRGCIYLHTFEPQIIHRDLKSRNVLLDSKKGTKITDFGEAREVDDRTLTSGIGTFQWMAPEVLVGSNYSAAADVYSFGIFLSAMIV